MYINIFFQISSIDDFLLFTTYEELIPPRLFTTGLYVIAVVYKEGTRRTVVNISSLIANFLLKNISQVKTE